MISGLSQLLELVDDDDGPLEHLIVNDQYGKVLVEQLVIGGLGQPVGVAAGSGIARNSAWANPDPDQMETYGLIAQYALDQAADAVVSDTVEPPAPPAPPIPPRQRNLVIASGN